MKTKHFLALALLGIVAACSSLNVNIPSIGEAGSTERLPGKIVWHELLTDTPEKTQAFYSSLFGWEFEALPDSRINYLLIRHQGKHIGGMIDQTRLPTEADISQWVVLMAVADINAAVAALKEEGGTVFTPPASLGDRGEIAVVADAQGALFALLQSPGGEPADSDELPLPGAFLWDELWTSDIDSAQQFYQALAPFEAEQIELGNDDHSVVYRVLSSQGHVRAGIRDNPVEGLPPIWVNYLRVADTSQLEDILSRVEPLGGEILVPAVDRPGGGKVAVIAGPSGAGIALQVWGENQRINQLEAANR